MGLPNLFTIAVENEQRFPERFEQVCREGAEAHVVLLRGFSRRVEQDGHVSVNMTFLKLNGLLDKGCYQNPHEVAKEKAAASSRPVEDILRELQGAWYDRRVAFDRYFEDGEQFRYGILNIGGDGPTYYGKYCVVFDRAAPWQTAYLPGNSLELYVTGPEKNHHVDEPSIREAAAPPGQQHRLAAIKHAGDLEATPEHAWHSMLCREGVFIEAIFQGEATVQQVEEIRVNRAELRRLGKLVVKHERDRSLPEHEEAEVLEFLAIRSKLATAGLSQRMKGV